MTTIEQQIKAALANHRPEGWDHAQISEAIGRNPRSVRQIIHLMMHAGRIGAAPWGISFRYYATQAEADANAAQAAAVRYRRYPGYVPEHVLMLRKRMPHMAEMCKITPLFKGVSNKVARNAVCRYLKDGWIYAVKVNGKNRYSVTDITWQDIKAVEDQIAAARKAAAERKRLNDQARFKLHREQLKAARPPKPARPAKVATPKPVKIAAQKAVKPALVARVARPAIVPKPAPVIVVTESTRVTIAPTRRGRFEPDPSHIGDFVRQWQELREAA